MSRCKSNTIGKAAQWAYTLSQTTTVGFDFAGSLLPFFSIKNKKGVEVLENTNDLAAIIICSAFVGCLRGYTAHKFQGPFIRKSFAPDTKGTPDHSAPNTPSQSLASASLVPERTRTSNLKEVLFILVSLLYEYASTTFSYSALKGLIENIKNEDNEDYLIFPTGAEWLSVIVLALLDFSYNLSNETAENCAELKKNSTGSKDNALIYTFLSKIAKHPTLQSGMLLVGTLTHIGWHMVGATLCIPDKVLNSLYKDVSTNGLSAGSFFKMAGLGTAILGFGFFNWFVTYNFETKNSKKNFKTSLRWNPTSDAGDDDKNSDGKAVSTFKRKPFSQAWYPFIRGGIRLTQGALHGLDDMMPVLQLLQHLQASGGDTWDDGPIYYGAALLVGLASWLGTQHSEIEECVEELDDQMTSYSVYLLPLDAKTEDLDCRNVPHKQIQLQKLADGTIQAYQRNAKQPITIYQPKEKQLGTTVLEEHDGAAIQQQLLELKFPESGQPLLYEFGPEEGSTQNTAHYIAEASACDVIIEAESCCLGLS